MAPTLTVEGQREAATTAVQRAADKLAKLQERRRELSPEALGGLAAAVKELAAIDKEIADVTREQDVARLAIQEVGRREQEARRQEADAQRAEDEAALDAALRRRDEHYRRVQDLIDQVAPEVRGALEQGAAIYDLHTRLGHPAAPDWTGRHVYHYICSRLGPLAGLLKDLDTPPPAARGDLVDGADRG